MSRLVEPIPVTMLAVADEMSIVPEGDRYAARLAKYIPGEVLSGYVAMSGIVASMDSDKTTTQWTAWAVFAIGLVLTPTYLVALSKLKRPWLLNVIISTIAFVIWSYALGGPFKLAGAYSPQIGSLLLIAFTLIAGILRPQPV